MSRTACGHRDAPWSWTRSTRRAEVVGVGAREDAVPQVEDVAGPPVVLGEDPAGRLLDALPGPQEQHRVQVPLDGPVADEPPALGQRDPPVEADDVAARGRLEVEDPAGPHAEVGRRDAERRDPLEQAAHPRPQPALVVERREAAHPGVEHLDGLRAGGHLGAEVRDRRVHEAVQQRGPGLGLARASAAWC